MRMMLVISALLAVMPPALVGIESASAQPASALGKPLPQKSLPTGTVTVRVIAGSRTAPVSQTDVTLTVNGEPRKARTNNEGRATFDKLTVGATVQATVEDAEGKPVQSDKFEVASNGGLAVMLTTKPYTGGDEAGPATAGGGGGGMPEPRKVSGQALKDGNLPPGALLARVTYNNMQVINGKATDSQPPTGETVYLVGYSADDTVDVRMLKTNAEGAVAFENLDSTGSTTYFALVALPRNGGFDRMRSGAVQFDGQSGVKMALSGEKRDSVAPWVDDHKMRKSDVPPGKIRISLEGNPHVGQPIRIIDVATKKVLAEAPATLPAPDDSDVQSMSQLQPNKSSPGKLEVQLMGGRGNKDFQPIGDVVVKFVTADDLATEVGTGTTAKDGWFETTLPTTGKFRAVYSYKKREFKSDPFELSKSGGRLTAVLGWGMQVGPEVVVDAPVEPTVVYAETVSTGAQIKGTFRSLPFQVVPTAGVHMPIMIYPRLSFSFMLKIFVEDEQLGVQGKWTVTNNSWAPYKDGDDGLLIRAPHGHRSGVLAGGNQTDVAVVPNEGFRLMRPLPPGEKTFIAGFSMPVDRGTVNFAWDMPLGTVDSHIEIKQSPGMVVDVPKGAQTGSGKTPDGTQWYVIDNIKIPAGQSLQMAIRRLPAPPLWRVWAPRFVGGFVVALMALGIVYALKKGKKPAVDGAVRARRAALLDELVELERTGDNPKRKEQVMAELERIWA